MVKADTVQADTVEPKKTETCDSAPIFESEGSSKEVRDAITKERFQLLAQELMEQVTASADSKC